MKIVVPMAGTGDRFIRAGYTDPKPLIKVGGTRIIETIVKMFDPSDDFIFICNENHIANTEMSKVLKDLNAKSTIVTIPQHKKGPVWTVKPFYDLIDDNEEVIVSYCDNPLYWDYEHFKKTVNERHLHGCILTHTGFHPHTLANTKMAFVKPKRGENPRNLIDEIQEKKCYTDNPMNEHASTGVYYFCDGDVMKRSFNELIDKDIHYNGEYYITLAYNLLIQDGFHVGYYDTDFVTVFGTPEEVQNFEAWKTIIEGGQVKSTEDAVKCYEYWCKFHSRK